MSANLAFLILLTRLLLVGSFPAVSESASPLLLRGTQQYYEGHYADALDTFQQSLRAARAQNDQNSVRKALNNIGGCQLALHRHREALKSLLEARDLSEKSKDIAKLGGLNNNICSIYKQMNNLDDATTAAEKGLYAAVRTHDIATQSKLQIQLADILGRQDKLPESVHLFRQAIDSADSIGDTATIAAALDRLGNTYRRHGFFPDADRALTEAFRLRKVLRLNELEWSYMNLAELRADQGDFNSALVLVNGAMSLLRTAKTTTPLWTFYYGRGKIYSQKGALPEAMADLRIALQLANELDAVPSDENRVFLEGELEPIHAALIDAGARLFLRNGDTRLVSETFEAAESNRAASLRALLPRANDWRNQLSPRYWEILPQLQAAEQDLYKAGTAESRDRVRRLRTSLSELVSSAGSQSAPVARHALAQARGSLASDTVLFSFRVAQPNSWLWAVTPSRIALHRLPSSADLSSALRKFTAAVRKDEASADAQGQALFNQIFGEVEPAFRNRRRWLLALDEDLFSTPFPALVVGHRDNRPLYLAEEHSIEISTGALMLNQSVPADFHGGFLGVGDPIYNTADPRWHHLVRPAASRLNLERLTGSGREVIACGRDWDATGRHSVVLLGADANKRGVTEAMGLTPSVIHFATHFVKSPQRFYSGVIALSLSSGGSPEVLGPDEIVLHPVRASLVVLSGCESGSARALPASGLMGLTRAWIATGSSAVLATQWDTLDDSGVFLLTFYRYFRAAPQQGPAPALYHARLDMLHSGTFRANPSYWAGYFLVGNS